MLYHAPVNRDPSESQNRPLPDPAFKRIVTIATAIGFAAILASIACVERSREHGFAFRWHWRAIVWMLAGVFFAFGFWERVWRLQAEETPKARSRLVRFCVFILLVSLASFLVPISFVPKENLSEVLTGLSVAAAALTLVGWIITKVIRAFLANDRKAESLREKRSEE